MNLSANSIIEKAMVEARITYPGESVPNSKIVSVWDKLNGLLESWALENLMVRADVQESFTLVTGTNTYTYGTGGTFNSTPPVHISDSVFIRQGDQDYPCTLKSLEYYRAISDKTTPGRPYIFAYSNEYPLIKVYFYFTPDSADTVFFKVPKEVASFADRTTSVNLANGYARAIISNLALEIGPMFGKKTPDNLLKIANESKRVIKSSNNQKNKEPMRTPHLSAMTGVSRCGRTSIINGPYG